MKKTILIFNFFLFVVVSCLFGTKIKSIEERTVKKSTKNYKIINSDVLNLKKDGTEIISQMRGNVHFFYDNIEFYSDEAEVYEKQQKVKLIGNVIIKQDTITVKAEDVTYLKELNKIILTENVFIKIDCKASKTIKTFSCQMAEIDRKSGDLKADKDIRFFDESRKVKVFCGKLRYNMNTRKGYLVDNPEIFSVDNDSTKLIAQKIDILDGQNKIKAIYGVKTISANHHTESEELIFLNEEKKIIMLGEPKFFSKKLYAEAKRFYFYSDMSFKNIEKIVLEENCEVDFPSEEGKAFDNHLVSNRVNLNFKNSNLKNVVATENVALSLINEDSTGVSVNKIYGDTLFLRFNDEKKLEYMTMKSKRVNGIFKFNN